MASSTEKKKKKKKRRSQAPVALVYFITLLVFLGVFGFVASLIVDRLTDEEEEIVDYSDTYMDSYNTVYARVNDSGVLSDLSLVRICPEQERIIIVPLSAFMIDSSGTTLREIYDEGGIIELTEAVDGIFSISTDYYVTVSNSAFEEIADIIGGFVYTPNEELYKLSDNDENDIALQEDVTVSLTGRQIRLLCQLDIFSNGHQGNLEFLGLALTNLVNNAFDQSELTTSAIDIFYSKLTANTSTNLTEADFKEQKVYLKDMLGNVENPAETLLPEGEWIDSTHLEVSNEFKQTLYDLMEETKASENSESDSAE